MPNNGGYETTPEEEWNFVVNPDLTKTYPGSRRGTKLDVYNLAHGAQKHGGSRLNMPLDVADNRLAEVAKQNACSAEKLVDSVKTVALRWGRANCLSEDPLKRAIKKLGETQDHSDTIRGLEALVKLGAKTLKELGEMLGEALEKAPRVEATGERSFAAVAEGVKDLASREMLEALARYSRTKLMETKACEEDVIGLRLYTGDLRSRSCSRALSFPNFLAGHRMSPLAERAQACLLRSCGRWARGRRPRRADFFGSLDELEKGGQPFETVFAPLSLSHTHTQPLYTHAYISSLSLLHRYVSLRSQGLLPLCVYYMYTREHSVLVADFGSLGLVCRAVVRQDQRRSSHQGQDQGGKQLLECDSRYRERHIQAFPGVRSSR